MTRWSVALFAVVGAFFVSGLAGAWLADLVGRWEDPFVGFGAALGVVCMAYLAAPAGKLRFSALVYLVGAALVWRMRDSFYYPDTHGYGDKAYQPTLLPVAAAWAGGFVGLALCAVVSRRRRGRSSPAAHANAGR